MKSAHLATALLALALAGCAMRQADPAVEASVVDVPASVPPGQLEFRLASGTYRCDMGHRVEVMRDETDTRAIRVGWTGRHYRLHRHASHSGLPRYEDPGSGLVWIDLPWKGMLLDGRSERPLASDCVLG